MKSCSHTNFVAILFVRLLDEETCLTHNVAGQGKPKLDPKIISFIKEKCFEMFPCNVNEKLASEWSSCVTAIDERSRTLKNKIGRKNAFKWHCSSEVITWLWHYNCNSGYTIYIIISVYYSLIVSACIFVCCKYAWYHSSSN